MRTAGLLLLITMAAQASAQTRIEAAPVLSPDGTLLSITAEGQSRRAPDLALFSAGVVTQATTAGAALSASAERMERVVAALRRAGVEARDLQTAAVSLQPRYSDPEREAQIRARELRQPYLPPTQPEAPRIIGYEARNTLNVRVRRLGQMGRIIDTLVGEGANQIDGPSFMVEDQRAALDEARTEAVANARARADLYARAAGLKVARVLSIAEGGGYYPVQQIMVTSRAMGRGAPPPPPPPPPPIAPGEVALGVSLSVQFELTP